MGDRPLHGYSGLRLGIRTHICSSAVGMAWDMLGTPTCPFCWRNRFYYGITRTTQEPSLSTMAWGFRVGVRSCISRNLSRYREEQY
jgi:hypothetical protein